MTQETAFSLDEHRAYFARSPFLAMPIAGADYRFVTIPAVIVAIYLVTIAALVRRWRADEHRSLIADR